MKNISFKKIRLIIRNNYSINRSIPLILALGICILGAIVGAMPISDLEARFSNRITAGFATFEDYHFSIRDLYDDMLGIDGAFSVMFMIITFALAFFSVIALTGYMREKSGTDFYHSVSVNRGEIYLAHYLTALINGVVTITLSQLLGLFFMNLIAKNPPLSFFEMLLAQAPVLLTSFVYLALFTAIAMLSATVSGTVFSTVVSFAFINFYAPATIFAVSLSGGQLFDTRLMNYLDHKPHAYLYSSPFIRYCYGTMGGDDLPFTALTFILMIIGALLLLLLGIYLYSRKKNENSQKPIAFSVLKRPLQYLIAFDAILLGATFFETITNSLAWCIIGGAVALLFTFIISNAFLDKSFAGVFKGSRHMIYIMIATLVAGTVFVADAFGIYKEPVPDVKNMEFASIYISYDGKDGNESYDFYFDEETEYRDTTAVLDDNAKKMLEDVYHSLSDLSEERRRANSMTTTVYEADKYYEEFSEYISISMNFKCKNDFSSYYVHFSANAGERGFDELREIIYRLTSNATHYKSFRNNSGEWFREETVIR